MDSIWKKEGGVWTKMSVPPSQISSVATGWIMENYGEYAHIMGSYMFPETTTQAWGSIFYIQYAYADLITLDKDIDSIVSTIGSMNQSTGTATVRTQLKSGDSKTIQGSAFLVRGTEGSYGGKVSFDIWIKWA